MIPGEKYSIEYETFEATCSDGGYDPDKWTESRSAYFIYSELPSGHKKQIDYHPYYSMEEAELVVAKLEGTEKQLLAKRRGIKLAEDKVTRATKHLEDCKEKLKKLRGW